MSVQFTELQKRLLAAPHPWLCRQWYEDREFYRTGCQITEADMPELRHLVEQWNHWFLPEELDGPDEVAEHYELLPIVAARALAEWPSEENFQILLARILDAEEDDDWLTEEIPKLWGRIGEVAIGPLAQLAADTMEGAMPRLAALEGIAEAYHQEISLRDQVAAIFIELLQAAERNPANINAVLAWELAEMRATEAAELIERTFAADLIDVGYAGSWEEHRQVLDIPGLGLPMPERPRNSLDFGFSADQLLGEDDLWITGADELESAEYDVDFTPTPYVQARERIGRNDPCPCGSGRKFKKCCLT